MRMITINVDDAAYSRFQERAKRSRRTASELIREAMDRYEAAEIPTSSIFETPPVSVGRILAAPSPNDDILGEMLS